MATASGFMQCFYSVLLVLFRAYSLLDVMADGFVRPHLPVSQ